MAMNKDDQEIWEEALERMDASSDHYDFITTQITDDLKFSSGEHWTPEEKELRGNRPSITVPKMDKYLDKVSGYFRENPPGAKVTAKFNTDQTTADVVRGYTRSFLSTNSAKIAVQTAGEHLTRCGYGWLYVGYEAENYRKPDEYSPKLILIDDPRSVRFDTASNDRDGNDGTWCMLLRVLDEEEAERKYGEDLCSVDNMPAEYARQWVDGNNIVLADYWYKEYVKAPIYDVVDIQTGKELTLWEEEVRQDKHQVVKKGEIDRCIIRYALISGAGVIETKEWPGLSLPIVPIYGKQVWTEDRKYFTGMVNAMRGPQRLINFYSSTAAEVTALSPRTPYILTADQIAGHEESYEDANIVNRPYHLYNYQEGASRPERAQQVTDVSPLLNALAGATQDLSDVAGIYEASLGQESQQRSGIAIENASKNSDQVIALYIDNLRRGVIRATQVAVGMLPYLYSDKRNIKFVTEEGDEHEIKVNAGPQEMDIQGLPPVLDIDLTLGEFDIAVDSAPSYQTRKQETSKHSIEMMSVLPEIQRGAISSEVVKMQDWVGAKRMARAIEATLPPEVKAALNADENIKEDPQAKAIMDQMKQEIEQGNAEADQMQQTITELQQALQQLQVAILSTRDDNATKMQIATLNAQKDIEVAQIKAGTDLETTDMEVESRNRLKMLDVKQKDDHKMLDTALNTARKVLGDSSMGPTGNVNGQIRRF